MGPGIQDNKRPAAATSRVLSMSSSVLPHSHKFYITSGGITTTLDRTTDDENYRLLAPPCHHLSILQLGVCPARTGSRS
eukprot:scaffold27138_cov67-Skeletonema_dohrnii-CCMP3373.AAC.1